MMKHLSSFFALVFCSTIGAQTFVTPDKTWLITECFADSSGSGGGTECTDFEYSFGEEVEIEGVEYLSLITDNDSELYYHTYYREEAGRVYARSEETEEFLVYDFNLEVGDMVTAGNPNAPGYNSTDFTVTELEYIGLEDGSIAKKIKLQNPLGASFYWIEGVGSNHNTFAPGTEWADDYSWHWFKCVLNQGELLYTESNSCSFVNTDNLSLSPLQIYPNPSSSFVNISLPSVNFEEDKILKIYSMTGKIILMKVIDNEMFSIDVSTFLKGVYLVDLSDREGIYYGKIIKQ